MSINDPDDYNDTYYDPPSGWKYGFPKLYEPSNPLEPLAYTLRRDGYPADQCEFAAKHTRFWKVPLNDV